MLRYGFRFGGSEIEASLRPLRRRRESEREVKKKTSKVCKGEKEREKDGLPKSLEGWNHGSKNRNQSHWLKAAPLRRGEAKRVCIYPRISLPAALCRRPRRRRVKRIMYTFISIFRTRARGYTFFFLLSIPLLLRYFERVWGNKARC